MIKIFGKVIRIMCVKELNTPKLFLYGFEITRFKKRTDYFLYNFFTLTRCENQNKSIILPQQ